MLVGARLGERSDAPCAVTSWRDRLYLAWTGTDMHVNVASSADGRQITGKQRLGVAWTGSDRGVNALDAGQPRPGPVTFTERSYESPSLAPAGPGLLAVAWTGTDRHVNLLTAADGPQGTRGLLAGAKSRLDQAKSDHAPAVCSHQGGLALAWTGSDRRVNLLAAAGHGPGIPVRLEDARTDSAPALCSYRGRLVLAWTGSDRHVNLLTVTDKGPGVSERLEARTHGGPALCSHQDQLVLAWTGSDRHVNLASVRLAAMARGEDRRTG